MTRFRPCIDLHAGKVKQIVGSTLTEHDGAPMCDGLIENFVADHTADWFAKKYRLDGLSGGHVIKLGPGNDEAAKEALAAFPGGLQIGGGINVANAESWLEAGASHVIVTSAIFDEQAQFQLGLLEQLAREVGRDKIVVDLSCKETARGWTVAMDRWQTLTDLNIEMETLDLISNYCAEFLIHAADVEGLCSGIDVELVKFLGRWQKIPMTYAGGVGRMAALELLATASNNRLDVTVGSALDLFGGTGVKYDEVIRWNQV